MYDFIVFMLSYMISYMKHHDVLTNLSCLAAADRPQAQRADASDADHDPDRKRGSIAAWPLPQRGRRKAAAQRIEHWPMIS